MLLATLFLRLFPNYVPYGMHEISDCLYFIVLTLFYHSSYYSFYVNFVSKRNIVYRHIFSSDLSLNDQLYHVFIMYANEM